MASRIYNEALRAIAAGEIDLNAADIRARLCMTNTTCDTENDAVVELEDFTTIDVCDATGYADIDMEGLAVNKDDPNDRAEFDATDLVFSGLSGDATRDAQGVLLYVYVDGTAANDKAVAFIDFTADIPAAATQVTVPWNAEGIIQFAQA
jgi:hypothetical protein